jgi:anti-sigma B factor antagonist
VSDQGTFFSTPVRGRYLQIPFFQSKNGIWRYGSLFLTIGLKLTASAGCVSFSFQTAGGFMRLSTRKSANIIIIDIDGKIVLGDGDVEIKRTVDSLIERGNKNFLLNLSKAPYLDSAGLGEIIHCFTSLRKIGGNLKLLSPNQRIIDLLTITKLLDVFDIYENESAAIASFS